MPTSVFLELSVGNIEGAVAVSLIMVLAAILLLAGASCIALGAVGSTVSRSIFDPVAFGDRAAASLSDPGVAAFAADRITNAVLEQSPDLTAGDDDADIIQFPTERVHGRFVLLDLAIKFLNISAEGLALVSHVG